MKKGTSLDALHVHSVCLIFAWTSAYRMCNGRLVSYVVQRPQLNNSPALLQVAAVVCLA